MGLMNDIGRGPVGVDTVIFIYFIEEHPQFLRLIEPLFREVDKGRVELITSALTLLEVLVVPYRTGDHLLAALRIYSYAQPPSPDCRYFSGSLARRRTGPDQNRVKTPDSLQLVAALSAGCTTFLTNNRDPARSPHFEGGFL